MFGSNDSKLSVRMDAVRIATTVNGVNTENIVEVSKKIADFIIGEANIPEFDATNDCLKRWMEKMATGSPNTQAIAGEVVKE